MGDGRAFGETRGVLENSGICTSIAWGGCAGSGSADASTATHHLKSAAAARFALSTRPKVNGSRLARRALGLGENLPPREFGTELALEVGRD